MEDEPAATGDFGGPSLETFTYSAGSYDRLKTNEEELFEMVKLSEVPIDKQLFKVILELLKLNVAPTAILQVLKSIRPQNTPDDLASRSPAPQRRADSKKHPQAPPLSSEPPPTSSSTPLPSASLSVRGTTNQNSDARSDGSDRSERSREGKESRSKTRKSSSERHKSSRHKQSKGGSGGGGVTGVKQRDHTGGSARLKIKELT